MAEEEDDSDMKVDDEYSSHSKDSLDLLMEEDDDENDNQVSDGSISDYDVCYFKCASRKYCFIFLLSFQGEDEEKKLLVKQQREAKRKAEANKRRLEVDFRRREKEEKRKIENKRKEMEEILKKKLEDERRQREEEYRLKMEKERAEELLRLESLKGQEYLKQKQIEKERREREEFRRKMEEVKLKQALEDERKRSYLYFVYGLLFDYINFQWKPKFLLWKKQND